MSASGKASKTPTKYFGLEDYVDLVLEATDSEAGGHPVRFACHKLEVAKAYKGFGDFLRKQELKVGEDGVKFIQITDVDAKTLDKILRHIYNVDIEENEMDAKLLEAAKHYKLDALFKTCLAATIPKKLTTENVLEAFKIAYQLDLPDEKNSTFQFIWEHLEELVGTNEFKELMVSNPSLVMDFMLKSKGLAMSVQLSSSHQEMENRIFPFTSNGPNNFEGDPVLIGTIISEFGIQELTLPDNLPMEAKGIRIIIIHKFFGGNHADENAFFKIWTQNGGGQCRHFIYRNRLKLKEHSRQAAPELYFSIDEKNRKIFADASKVVKIEPHREHDANDFTLSLFLVGYTL